MNMLDAILGEDIVNLLDGICSFASLPWYYTTPIRQPNTADCGVFVLRNMEDPTSKWAQKVLPHVQSFYKLLDLVKLIVIVSNLIYNCSMILILRDSGCCWIALDMKKMRSLIYTARSSNHCSVGREGRNSRNRFPRPMTPRLPRLL